MSRGKRERGIVEDPESGGGTKAGSDGTERGLREIFTDVWRPRFGVGVRAGQDLLNRDEDLMGLTIERARGFRGDKGMIRRRQ